MVWCAAPSRSLGTGAARYVIDIRLDVVQVELPADAECSPECPATHGLLETAPLRVEPGAPAREASTVIWSQASHRAGLPRQAGIRLRRDVGDDAQQSRLFVTAAAAHTRADR